LTTDAIAFGLKFVAASAYPYILAGFNSLCGYASINHVNSVNYVFISKFSLCF